MLEIQTRNSSLHHHFFLFFPQWICFWCDWWLASWIVSTKLYFFQMREIIATIPAISQSLNTDKWIMNNLLASIWMVEHQFDSLKLIDNSITSKWCVKNRFDAMFDKSPFNIHILNYFVIVKDSKRESISTKAYQLLISYIFKFCFDLNENSRFGESENCLN